MLDAHELEATVQQQDKDIEAMAERCDVTQKKIGSLKTQLGMHQNRIEELEAERDQLRSTLDFIRGHMYEIGKAI